MYAAKIACDAGEAEFREVAKRCLAAKIHPQEVVFTGEAALLQDIPRDCALAPFSIPRELAALIATTICHRAPDRFALLYEVLWRTLRRERELIRRAADPAIAKLNEYARNVRRDIHKMHAFVRFREQEVNGAKFYTAWFEPQHYTLKRGVPFFVNRFANMDWMIATPIGTALHAGGALTFGPAGMKPDVTDDAVLDELWLAYFRTTFNPARVRLKAMGKEMPKLYWKNMPETAAIPDMVANAADRVIEMKKLAPDQPQLFAERIAERGMPERELPRTPLGTLRREADACKRCPLHTHATQTVFGEGPENADLVFVGEQPGDQEDLQGKPFVGPAGQLFDKALAEAGIERDRVYVTNAVKHFKFEPRGKRRIHQRPNVSEIKACKWWLDRELAAIRPKLVVALGASAAQALAGKSIAVTKARGAFDFGGQEGFITVHPSFLLRIPEEDRKQTEYRNFVEDLKEIRKWMARSQAA
jgi:probable DNA metabolism protein